MHNAWNRPEIEEQNQFSSKRARGGGEEIRQIDYLNIAFVQITQKSRVHLGKISVTVSFTLTRLGHPGVLGAVITGSNLYQKYVYDTAP